MKSRESSLNSRARCLRGPGLTASVRRGRRARTFTFLARGIGIQSLGILDKNDRGTSKEHASSRLGLGPITFCPKGSHELPPITRISKLTDFNCDLRFFLSFFQFKFGLLKLLIGICITDEMIILRTTIKYVYGFDKFRTKF